MLLTLLKPSSTDLSNTDYTFAQKVVRWHHQHGRKNLPWQLETGEHKSYHVWLSEIMLQQTQVVKVKDYFNRFIAEFPTLNELAGADEQQVLALWSGLGYYNRARNLHKTAKRCVENYAGTMPCDLQQLIDLPGIGRSTAAAIMSLAYNQPEPIMDGNVKRVFSRHFLVKGEPSKSSTINELWQLAEINRELNEPAAYTQGLMDLGATVCTKNQPKCNQCPIAMTCQAKLKDVIDQYPHKKRKVKQTEVHMHSLLSIKDKKIALSIREAKGIWPQLWFTPLFNSEAELIRYHPNVKHQFSLTHKLTHRILHIHIYKSDGPVLIDGIKWVNTDQLKQYPHPKALNHIINQYENL